jgi:hypothetical protein
MYTLFSLEHDDPTLAESGLELHVAVAKLMAKAGRQFEMRRHGGTMTLCASPEGTDCLRAPSPLEPTEVTSDEPDDRAARIAIHEQIVAGVIPCGSWHVVTDERYREETAKTLTTVTRF